MLRLSDDPLANIQNFSSTVSEVDKSYRAHPITNICVRSDGSCQHAKVIVGYTGRKEITITHTGTAQ